MSRALEHAIEEMKAENDNLKTENEIKNLELQKITRKYAADASEKEEMLRLIKQDIETVSQDVTKSNELLAEVQLKNIIKKMIFLILKFFGIVLNVYRIVKTFVKGANFTRIVGGWKQKADDNNW